MTLTDHDEIDFQLRLADTNLDTVLVQAEHLSMCKNNDMCVRVWNVHDLILHVNYTYL